MDAPIFDLFKWIKTTLEQMIMLLYQDASGFEIFAVIKGQPSYQLTLFGGSTVLQST